MAAFAGLGGLAACGAEPAASSSVLAPTGSAPVATAALHDSVPDSSMPGNRPDAPLDIVDRTVEAPVIRWTTRWWDPQLGRFGAPSQDIAVYADGTVVGASTVDAAAQPMVWPYVTGSIASDAVAGLLAAADEAGLLASAEPVDGNPNVAGAPVTFVELRTAAGVFTHRVHALQTPTADDTEYLAGLRGFVAQIQDATRDALNPQTATGAPSTRVVVTATAGDLPAGHAATEWVGPLDLATAADGAVTDDPATIAFLKTRLSREHFVQRGVTYAVTAYQLIPGEAGCDDGAIDDGRGGSDERKGWAVDGEVIRITTQALYPVTPPFVPAGPDVVVYADGSVLVPFHGAFEVQPMVWPYEHGRIGPSELAALYDMAAAGLLGATEPRLFTRVDVVDAPRTTVVMATGAGRFQLQADALSSAADDEPEEVAALRTFVGRVHAAIEPVGDGGEFYEPVALALAATPVESSDGRDALEWPGGVRLAEVAECTIVTDPDTLAVLGQQYAGQRYVDDGVTYRLAARVAFPGDTTC